MLEVDALSAEFLGVRPTYEALGQRVASILDAQRKEAGIKGSVTTRPKDVDSFIKKAIRKGYSDPMQDIKDKAGVRVVVVYKDDIPALQAIIHDCFLVHHWEDKIRELGSAKLGYQGVHFEVALRTDDIGDSKELTDLICEIQIHTRAQTAWAEASHELIYKAVAKPPTDIERRIMLLQAMVEMFDREVVDVRKELVNASEGRTARMLAMLEPHFLRLAGVDYDQELTLSMLAVVDPLYEGDDIDGVERRLTEFIATNRTKLKELFQSYREEGSGTNPLLLQPESLPIFERLEHDKFAVIDIWDQHLDRNLLDRLAAGWGLAMPDL